jgi:hypothetical protein
VRRGERELIKFAFVVGPPTAFAAALGLYPPSVDGAIQFISSPAAFGIQFQCNVNVHPLINKGRRNNGGMSSRVEKGTGEYVLFVVEQKVRKYVRQKVQEKMNKNDKFV